MNLIEELRWRGMIHDIMPGTEALLETERVSVYSGIDPTADSLHVGHFVAVMTLRHMQLRGHRPIALIGGATGMIGDPSGKSEERNLLDEETLRHNERSIANQLERFLDFSGENAAEVVNNYDWFRDMRYLDFIRDIGKHITVSYMMAKDSVKKRLDTGMSFTEFTYQLAQGYDYLHLFREKGCRLQIGGSDQWGNIVTGTELIRRKDGGEAWALTWPLITKADGSKFGKTESGNIWLDRERTSPYRFYQYWLNASDEDAKRYLRIFTFHSPQEIEALEVEQEAAPHQRAIQHALANSLTERVHSAEDLSQAVAASQILFGKSAPEQLAALNEQTFLEVFDGVPQHRLSRDLLADGLALPELLAEHTDVLKSKGEVRRALKENSLSINKHKGFTEESTVTAEDLLNGRYLLVQRGKRNYYLILAE